MGKEPILPPGWSSGVDPRFSEEYFWKEGVPMISCPGRDGECRRNNSCRCRGKGDVPKKTFKKIPNKEFKGLGWVTRYKEHYKANVPVDLLQALNFKRGHGQTACCLTNDNSLDLRELTIHDLFNGVCNGDGDIKDEFQKKYPMVAEQKPHLTPAEMKQRGVQQKRHLRSKNDEPIYADWERIEVYSKTIGKWCSGVYRCAMDPGNRANHCCVEYDVNPGKILGMPLHFIRKVPKDRL